MNQIKTQQSGMFQTQKSKWIWYLTRNRSDPILTSTDRIRLGHAEYFYQLEQEEYSLYHLSLTYKPITNIPLTPMIVNKFFIRFHMDYLLPMLLGTKNIHHMSNREFQPKVFSFLDEHRHDKFTGAGMPARLHHHAIYAVHPATKEIMDTYIGENTFGLIGDRSSPYMTSDLRSCESTTVLYASKMYQGYPDFLTFPDKMKRSRCKDYQKRQKNKFPSRSNKEFA